jgi:hypothetical protein
MLSLPFARKVHSEQKEDCGVDLSGYCLPIELHRAKQLPLGVLRGVRAVPTLTLYFRAFFAASITFSSSSAGSSW